jgi:general secretion pathway protein D
MLGRILILLALLAVSGCAADRAFKEGRALVESGEVEPGLARVQEASRLDPHNLAYRQYYVRQRDIAVQRYIALAESARTAGRYDEAEAAYRRAQALDPDNPRAANGIEALRIDRRHRALVADAEERLKKGDVDGAYAEVREVLAQNSTQPQALRLLNRLEEQSARARAASPKLSAALRKPVTLEFRDAPLRTVFEILSRHSGLNFIFDRDVRPDLRTTIFVTDTSIDEAIRLLLVTNQLERKIVNDNTILIYPNTPAKIRDYKDLLVRSFYLANADVKQTANMIRALVKTRDLYVDDKLNMLVMRDTPEAVRVAERLIANQDLGEPEVMLDVEVLEVGRNRLQDLGIQWPNQVSYSLEGAAGIPGTVTLPEWQNRNSSLVRMTVSDPFLVLNLREEVGTTNVLANPRIRVKNHEKARIHIGDKVPVITTTTTATGFVAESVTYLDVGLKLDVEPTVYLDNDVGIKIGLEVSNITNQIKSSTGTVTYQVGTRTASTTLRLADGETQVLAGLISDEDRRNAAKVPGLGDLPILGRLFASHNDTANKTEIVLLITPHVVRNIARPGRRLEEFSSGTEAAVGAGPTAQAALAGAAYRGMGTPPLEAPAARFTLQAPAQIAAGQEFTATLGVAAPAAFRSGALQISFDPSALRFVRAEPGPLLGAAGELAFSASAPESSGRLSLSFTSKADIQGSGEAARLVFQTLGSAAGSPELKVETLSISDAGNRALAAEAPAPVTLAIKR